MEHNVRIAQDGDTVRVLGAWIGKGVEDAAPWEPLMDKMTTKIQNWKNTHPTLYGKRPSCDRRSHAIPRKAGPRI